MNAVADFSNVQAFDVPPAEVLQVDETYWGYIVRSKARVRSIVFIGQAISGLFAMSSFVAAAGLWLMPSTQMNAEMLVMKAVTTGFLVILSLFLTRFAVQGTLPEVQVDTSREEVRVMMRNRKGRVRLLSRFTFNEIGSVFIEPAKVENGKAKLCLRYCDTDHVIVMADAPAEMLAGLRERVGRDILVRNSNPFPPVLRNVYSPFGTKALSL